MQLRPVELDRPTNIVVLTGAGISAGSGLPTFRGTGSTFGRDPTQTLDVSRLHEGLDEIWA
jgi:NAD-dependent SIR2 family protein deacetylase